MNSLVTKCGCSSLGLCPVYRWIHSSLRLVNSLKIQWKHLTFKNTFCYNKKLMIVLSKLSIPLDPLFNFFFFFFHIWEMWKFDIKRGCCCFLHRIKFSQIFGVNLSGHWSAPATASEQANMAQVLTCKLLACLHAEAISNQITRQSVVDYWVTLISCTNQ